MREHSVAFGVDGGLIGTLCIPSGEMRDVALVLFNAGVVHRIGPHRLHVKLAREMASYSMASIRFDLHGMGDSSRSREAIGHSEQVVLDIRSAMDELQRVSGATRFALLGFCSGVPQSVAVALADPRVSSIILYDGFVLRTPLARWRYLGIRLRAHGLNFRAMRLWVRRAAQAATAWLRRAAESREVEAKPARELLFTQLRSLRDRGVDVVVLVAGADYSEFNYREQARRALGVHAEGIRFGFLDRVDHVLTSRQAQQDYLAWVRRALLSPYGAASKPGTVAPVTECGA